MCFGEGEVVHARSVGQDDEARNERVRESMGSTLTQLCSRTFFCFDIGSYSPGGSRGRVRIVILLREYKVLGQFRPGSRD
jgi:hypothetical protein